MEPKKQVEIQLGHLCNNRCVFCVSGQQTAMGRARPMDAAPLLAEVSRARAEGHTKLTLLGGEPTLQPAFMDVVRHAVALGFEEIVIFTNGVKTAREALVDEILATGGRFTWRISIQGGTEEAHERTTRKDGSFARILRSMEALSARGQRITVNLCVVRSNADSVVELPALLARYGASQLHLDMLRPLDAGERSEDEMRATLPRYAELAAPLRAMIARFPPGFDVNIGNLPYCVAPDLAPFVHHDGEETTTIAVDGERELSRPWNKYLVKRRDKLKPASCRACVFDARCSGVFDTYRAFYGTDELVPVTAGQLAAVDPERRLFALHLRPVAAAVDAWAPPAPWRRARAFEASDVELAIELSGEPEGEAGLAVALRRPGEPGAVCAFEAFGVHLARAPGDPARTAAGLDALAGLLAPFGGELVHPPGPDAAGALARSVGARVARLRAAAPFGSLRFRELHAKDGGARAEALFVAPSGERAVVWLADDGGRATGGYRLDGAPTPALVEGLRAVMAALGATAPGGKAGRAAGRAT